MFRKLLAGAAISVAALAIPAFSATAAFAGVNGGNGPPTCTPSPQNSYHCPNGGGSNGGNNNGGNGNDQCSPPKGLLTADTTWISDNTKCQPPENQGPPKDPCQQYDKSWSGGKDCFSPPKPKDSCQQYNGDSKGTWDCQQPPKDPCQYGWDGKGNDSKGSRDCILPPVIKFCQYDDKNHQYSDSGHWYSDNRCSRPDPCQQWSKDSSRNNCFTSYPKPHRYCMTELVTFETPTYGTWMLDVPGSPKLHDGEVLTYEGQAWTVEDWTTPPNPAANGSQGIGDYFTLTNGSHYTLSIPGNKAHHGSIKTEYAHTTCSGQHLFV